MTLKSQKLTGNSGKWSGNSVPVQQVSCRVAPVCCIMYPRGHTEHQEGLDTTLAAGEPDLSLTLSLYIYMYSYPCSLHMNLFVN